MTRQEHLEWCKERALAYLDTGDLLNAITSMMSDLQKHDETKLRPDSPLIQIGLMSVMSGDQEGVRRFIVGFN